MVYYLVPNNSLEAPVYVFLSPLICLAHTWSTNPILEPTESIWFPKPNHQRRDSVRATPRQPHYYWKYEFAAVGNKLGAFQE